MFIFTSPALLYLFILYTQLLQQTIYQKSMCNVMQIRTTLYCHAKHSAGLRHETKWKPQCLRCREKQLKAETVFKARHTLIKRLQLFQYYHKRLLDCGSSGKKALPFMYSVFIKEPAITASFWGSHQSCTVIYWS